MSLGLKKCLDRGIKTKWKSRQNRGSKSPDTSSGVSSGSENSGPESPVVDWRLHNNDCRERKIEHIPGGPDSTGGSDTNSSDDGEFRRDEKSTKNRIWRRSSVKTVSSTTTTTSISTEAEESVLYYIVYMMTYKLYEVSS